MREMTKSELAALMPPAPVEVRLAIRKKTWITTGRVVRRLNDALRRPDAVALVVDVGGTTIGFTAGNVCVTAGFEDQTKLITEVER